MNASESIENYLECILKLHVEHPSVRSIDIAAELGVTKPSVSHATKLMRQNNWITIDDDGFISLTDEGKEIAERVYERHRVIATMLKNLGVSEKTALEDACRIEHDISDESFEALRRHLDERAHPDK